jgi:hypothetical protein
MLGEVQILPQLFPQALLKADFIDFRNQNAQLLEITGLFQSRYKVCFYHHGFNSIEPAEFPPNKPYFYHSFPSPSAFTNLLT